MINVDPALWDRALALVRAARTVLLLGHISPDGDALGSALAFGLALRKLDSTKVVHVSFGDEPFVVPANLQSLPGLSLLVRPSAVPSDLDLVITFDASSADRLGLLRQRAEAAPHLIVVDHHASFDGFGDTPLVDAAAPATAVVVDEFISRLGVELDGEMAACLYTGLVTDTGSFRYAGTSAATHEFAGRLLETGIPFDEISRELFDDAPFGYLKLLGNALTRTTLDIEAAVGLGMVWTMVPASERMADGLAFDLVEPIIDVVRKASEAEVAVVIKEDDGGELRISLRSKGRVDVSKVASRLGGGGHVYAAGFTASSRDPDSVISSIKEQLSAASRVTVS